MTTPPHVETEQTSELRNADRAARVAVEELTGLALQERGLTALLARQVAEAPLGGPRERLERHLQQSRQHSGLFDDRVQALKAHRGGGELAVGLFRSGLAALGVVGATIGQMVSLPLTVVRRGGGEERLLENAGVEGAALAIKLVILTAVTQALELTGDDASHQALRTARDEARATWDELLEQTPVLMKALVRARAQESSYDFRTTGASDAIYDRLGPGHASGAQARTRPPRASTTTRRQPARSGAGAKAKA